jgi:hypothetical protein
MKICVLFCFQCLFPLDERNLDSIVIKRKLDINDVGGNVKRKKRKQVSSDRFLCTTGTASCVSHEFIQPQEGQTTAVVSKPALGLQLTSGNRVINFNYGSRQRVIPCHETFQSYVKSSTSSAMPPVVTSSFVSRAQPCHISSSNARSLAQSLIAPAIADNEILLVAQSHSVTSPALPPLNGMSLEDNKMQLGQDGNQGELPSKSNPEKSLEKGTVEQLKHSSRRQEHLQFSSAKHLSELTMEHSTSNTNPSNTGGDEKDLVGGSKTDLKLSRSREDLSSVLADRLFLHWTNSDAMCWLDVAMAMIVHCQSLRHAVVSDINTEQSSCIRKLLREYDRAQADFRRSSKLNRCHYLCGQGKMVKLETSVGHITVKTGGGSNGAGLQLGALVNPADQIATIDVDDVSEIICDSDKNTTSVERVSQVARHLDEQAKQILVDVREHVFSVMQETMQCERGQNDSALLALSSLLTEDAYVSEQFLVKYTFSLECGKCSHVEANR